MKRYQPILVLAFALCSTGCGAFRYMEQWKCDNFGMCHFGVQPTPFTPPQQACPCPTPGYAPAPSYAPAPQYGTPAPQYGTPAPQYGTPAPQYGAPIPEYGTLPPAL
ncbi:hypothetical protein NHH03_08645 [Stieleria sp. TO1_6]|uniref:hypothetical protein n=1 Tax=Stieleria tagensis TaxID=2956795 RepID=UPI00209B5C34|nr:hypothetical protein [Stieleria tagensis]MCO8121803.1 hypothetical protein [Stieleria tagensis]